MRFRAGVALGILAWIVLMLLFAVFRSVVDLAPTVELSGRWLILLAAVAYGARASRRATAPLEGAENSRSPGTDDGDSGHERE